MFYSFPWCNERLRERRPFVLSQDYKNRLCMKGAFVNMEHAKIKHSQVQYGGVGMLRKKHEIALN